jgi:hypothetical protein
MRKALSRPLVFYPLPDVEYESDNCALIDRRYKSEEECRKAGERELAATPITEHPNKYVPSCRISGMSCDQA